MRNKLLSDLPAFTSLVETEEVVARDQEGVSHCLHNFNQNNYTDFSLAERTNFGGFEW